MYGRRWRTARALHLQHSPLCVMCSAKGVVRPARVVDHKRPHKGNASLFWDQNNWQSLCYPHHDRDKQSEERGPEVCGSDGYPTTGGW